MVKCRFYDFLPSPVIVAENGIGRGKARIGRGGIYYYPLKELKGFNVIPDDFKKSLVAVLRPPEFLKENLHLFDQIPIVLNHIWLDRFNTNLINGFSSSPAYVDGWIELNVALYNKALNAFENEGYKEFSTGHDGNLIYEPGQWTDSLNVMGQPNQVYDYDCILYPKKMNHLAFVKENQGRAGFHSEKKPQLINNLNFCNSIIDFDEMENMEETENMKHSEGTENMGMKIPLNMIPVLKNMFSYLGNMAKRMNYENMTSLEFDNGNYMIPNDMEDMMTKYQNMMEENKKTEVVNSGDYVLIETYRLLQDQFQQNKGSVAALQAENIDLKTKLENALNPEKINQLLKERNDSFEQALPFLNGFSFDPTQEADHWKKEALLQAGHSEEILNSFDSNTLNGAFLTLTLTGKKTPQKSSLSEKIANSRQQEPLENYGSSLNTEDLPQNRSMPTILGSNN